MERSILNIKLRDKFRCAKIRKKTRIIDALYMKYKWAGHVIRTSDDKWTKNTTEWIPREGHRKRGRQCTRWRDDLEKLGGTWTRLARDRREWSTLCENV